MINYTGIKQRGIGVGFLKKIVDLNEVIKILDIPKEEILEVISSFSQETLKPVNKQ